MATSFTKAEDYDSKVLEIRNRMMRENHPELEEAGVKVDVLMAYNPKGDAVKCHGCGALAVVRVMPLKQRVKGAGDAEITIDQTKWEEHTPEEQDAAMDHELEHLVRVERKAKKGKPLEEGETPWATDDIGRPKLKLRPGDWNVGDAFAAICARHGANAIEFANIRRGMDLANMAKAEGDVTSSLLDEVLR